MAAERLSSDQLAELMMDWPAEIRALGLAARARVLELAPALSETIAFHALCYARPGAAYGVIGGNVCLVSLRAGQLELGFLHGASLPDPDGRLRGEGKAKRRLPIRTFEDLQDPRVAELILAAVALDPTA